MVVLIEIEVVAELTEVVEVVTVVVLTELAVVCN